MCDTIVNVQNSGVFFAKNSDRDANEPQLIEWHPPRKNLPKKTKCTYIEVESALETHRILISRPAWMWGAEMGTNEFGVTIGNEAVFTKHRVPKIGLTGMDLIRLALERSSTAKHALETIISLIERYGQGGSGSLNNINFRYFSSFLIADRTEAYVLETTQNDYAFEQVKEGVRTISNGLTIRPFSDKYSDYLYTKVNSCRIRQPRSAHLAKNATGVLDYMNILRDHGENKIAPGYRWINGAMDSVCMHAGGLLAASQTTASWVTHLTEKQDTHWVTATAAPCTSLFKPVSVKEPLQTIFQNSFSALEYWHSHEPVHQKLISCPQNASLYLEERNCLEKIWTTKKIPSTKEAFETSAQIEKDFLTAAQNFHSDDKRPWYVKRHWNHLRKMEL